MTDREQVQAFVKDAHAKWDRIDVMLHNADVMPMAPLIANRWQEWDQCIDVNLKGVLYGLGAVDTELPSSVKAEGVSRILEL